jgi:hypothetical protein
MKPSANQTLETNADFDSLRRHRSAFRLAVNHDELCDSIVL